MEDLRVTIHMVSSLDGIIAKPDNSVAWFETKDHYEAGASEPSGEEFLQVVDCYVMGSRTYEHALELSRSYGWAYGEVPTIVLTSRDLPVERKNVELFAGDLPSLMNDRLRPTFKKVWVVGGAQLANEFIRQGFADDIRLSVLPIILGEGKKFFEQLEHEHPLHLHKVTGYKSGMVELWYEIKSSSEGVFPRR